MDEAKHFLENKKVIHQKIDNIIFDDFDKESYSFEG